MMRSFHLWNCLSHWCFSTIFKGIIFMNMRNLHLVPHEIVVLRTGKRTWGIDLYAGEILGYFHLWRLFLLTPTILIMKSKSRHDDFCSFKIIGTCVFLSPIVTKVECTFYIHIMRHWRFALVANFNSVEVQCEYKRITVSVSESCWYFNMYSQT